MEGTDTAAIVAGRRSVVTKTYSPHGRGANGGGAHDNLPVRPRVAGNAGGGAGRQLSCGNEVAGPLAQGLEQRTHNRAPLAVFVRPLRNAGGPGEALHGLLDSLRGRGAPQRVSIPISEPTEQTPPPRQVPGVGCSVRLGGTEQRVGVQGGVSVSQPQFEGQTRPRAPVRLTVGCFRFGPGRYDSVAQRVTRRAAKRTLIFALAGIP